MRKRVCPKCGVEKTIDRFSKVSLGEKYIPCKKCERERMREYNRTEKARKYKREYMRAYRLKIDA